MLTFHFEPLIAFILPLYIFVCLSARVRPDNVSRLRTGHDGGDSGNGAAAGRGRHRLTFCHLLDSAVRQLLHSSVPAPARVLVHRPRHALPAAHPVHVPLAHHLRAGQLEQRLVGHAGGVDQEDQGGE